MKRISWLPGERAELLLPLLLAHLLPPPSPFPISFLLQIRASEFEDPDLVEFLLQF